MPKPKRLSQISGKAKRGGKEVFESFIALDDYLEKKAFVKDGFADQEEAVSWYCDDATVARSTTMAKLKVVRTLLKSGAVKPEELSEMGSTKAQELSRVVKAQGKLSGEWKAQAKSAKVSEFKDAVAKALKPTEEPRKYWRALLTVDLQEAWAGQEERVKGLLGVESAEGFVEFLHSLLEGMADAEILHAAGKHQEAEALLKRKKTA